MKSPVNAMEVAAETDTLFPEPFRSKLDKAQWRRLGDAFGLAQFGVNLETIQPGGQATLRHWHTQSEEFVFVLEGELILVSEGGETPMNAGMCIGFPAGGAEGRHLVNRSEEAATLLAVGGRVEGDEVCYPDDDLQWLRRDGQWIPAHRDGTPYL